MRRLSLWEVVTVCGLLCSSASVLGSSIDSDLTLTVAAGGCTAFELDGLPQKFGYSETVDAWTLGTCAASTVSFSKFYIQDACIALRNNELGLNSITHSRCKEATDNTASVCQQVFATNGSNLIGGGTLGSLPQIIDSDNVCSSSSTGFVYIQNTCSTPISATVKLVKKDYAGGPCINVAGHSLNTWAIIIIVIVGIAVLMIGFWILSCLCCQALTCCGCCCCR